MTEPEVWTFFWGGREVISLETDSFDLTILLHWEPVSRLLNVRRTRTITSSWGLVSVVLCGRGSSKRIERHIAM